MGNTPSVEDGSRAVPHKLNKRPRWRGQEQQSTPETFDYSDRDTNLGIVTDSEMTTMRDYTSKAPYAVGIVPDNIDQFDSTRPDVPRRGTWDSFSQFRPRLKANASQESLRRHDTGRSANTDLQPDNSFHETHQPRVYNPLPRENVVVSMEGSGRPQQEPSRPNLYRAKTAPSSRPQSLPGTRELPWDSTSTVRHSSQAEPVPRPPLEARVRRRSLNQVPGVATRKIVAKSLSGSRNRQPDDSMGTVDWQKLKDTRRASMPLLALTQDEEQPRAVTPTEAEYRGLGTVKFGSLRITNGARTPSPTPSTARKRVSKLPTSGPGPCPLTADLEYTTTTDTGYKLPPDSSRTHLVQMIAGPVQESQNSPFLRPEELRRSFTEEVRLRPGALLAPHPDSGYSSSISILDKESLSVVEATAKPNDSSQVISQAGAKEEDGSSQELHNNILPPPVDQESRSMTQPESCVSEERASRGVTLATLSKRLPSLKRSKSKGVASVKSSSHSRTQSTETDVSISASSIHRLFSKRRKSLPNAHKVPDTVEPVPPIPQDIEDRIRTGNIPRASPAEHIPPLANIGRSESSTSAWRSSLAPQSPSNPPSTPFERGSGVPRHKQPQGRPSSVYSGKMRLWNQGHHNATDLNHGLDDDAIADDIIDDAQIYDIHTTQMNIGNSAFDQALLTMNRPAPTAVPEFPQKPRRPNSVRAYTAPERSLRHRSSAPDLHRSGAPPPSPSASEASHAFLLKPAPPISMHSQRTRNLRTPPPGAPRMQTRRPYSQAGPYPSALSPANSHPGVPTPPHGQRSPRRSASQQQGSFEPRREMASLPLWQQSQVIPEYGTRQHFRSHNQNQQPRSPLHSQDGRGMSRRSSQRRSLRTHQNLGDPNASMRPASRAQGGRSGGM